MGIAFPLSPVPSGFAYITSTAVRNNIYTIGNTPSFTLSNATNANAYTVRDYYGTVVSSGAVSSATVVPTAPVGGWKLGWYRLYVTGSVNDALFGLSLGATNFIIIRSDARFPTLPNSVSFSSGSEGRDLIMKGALGIGTSRLTVDVVTPGGVSSGSSDNLASVQTAVPFAKTYWSAPGAPYADSARPRLLWTNIVATGCDFMTIGSLNIYPATELIDGSTLTVATVAGTTSGTKLTVTVSGVLMETYDNLASASAAVVATAASPRIKCFGAGILSAGQSRVVGRTIWNNLVSIVSALYPDVTRFEGPSNEPGLTAETAHQMRLFQGAVHAGNAGAKAIGPCPVDIGDLAAWQVFFTAGGGNYCDEISFHDYNSMTNGDISLGRETITAFKSLLASNGMGAKVLWQTEAGAAFNSVYGTYHPRRGRVNLLHTLLWEQYNIPRERNPVWYDGSHGFWSFPTWLAMADSSLNPQCAMYRVLAEETFGQAHSQSLTFGPIADRIILGSVYAGTAGSTAVLILTSVMPGATVTLSLTGVPGTLTVVDTFGVVSSVVVTKGKVTFAVTETPTYLRLPVGGAITAASFSDWSAAGAQAQVANSSLSAKATLDGVFNTAINDGSFPKSYPNVVFVSTVLPSALILTWPSAARVDRVLIYGGAAWQSGSALLDFDVQTSVNGTTWVTQRTITKSTPQSFLHGTDWFNAGTQRETFWDEQWIFDVKFPAPVTCKAVRVFVRTTSYGGEPDAACLATGGQGDIPHFAAQEIVVLCDDNSIPQYLAT